MRGEGTCGGSLETRAGIANPLLVVPWSLLGLRAGWALAHLVTGMVADLGGSIRVTCW